MAFFAQIAPETRLGGVYQVPNFMENMNLTKKMDILIFTNFHPLLSSKMTKNAETAKICPNKAGHMETMAKNFIFEVKTVAKWLQKPKNRRAIFAGRGS